MAKRQTEIIQGEAKEVGPSTGSKTILSNPGGDPLLPWFNTFSGLQVNYQITQIMMDARGASVITKRKQLKEGVITEEQMELIAAPQLYLQAVEQFQQQTEQMMKTMLSPWLGLMGPLGHLQSETKKRDG